MADKLRRRFQSLVVLCVIASSSSVLLHAQDVNRLEAKKNPSQKRSHVRVGLASLRLAKDVDSGVTKITQTLADCRKAGVEIVCFPETYLPGLRGGDKNLPPIDQPAMQRALKEVADACRTNQVAAIVGMEWKAKRGLENRAFVIDRSGKVLGYQTKNQITPGGESKNYVPDGKRQMFDIDGVRFGIAICHEGWRYPETVRWAAVRGAQIVFQPQVTGSDSLDPAPPTKWGESFYEKAMICRAEENSVYFISVNRTMRRQNSASSVIDPNGDLVKFVPRGEEKLLVVDLDLTKATGRYASRFQPKLYEENDSEKTIVPLASDITEIKMVEHRSLQRPAIVTLLHLRADDSPLFQGLATALVKRGFFDLESQYGRVFPDANSISITVTHGKQQKTVARFLGGKVDDAWEFEMLIRGIATQVKQSTE